MKTRRATTVLQLVFICAAITACSLWSFFPSSWSSSASKVDASAGSSSLPANFSSVPKFNQSAEVTSSTTTTTTTTATTTLSSSSSSPSSLNQNGVAISELFISNSSLSNANNRSRRSPADHNNSLSKNRHYPSPLHVRNANACDFGHSCTEGSSCAPTGEPGKYSCVCRPGLTGPFCEQDIDECYEQPGICRNGATCTNTIGSYSCICVNGWTGNHCDSNIDDCASAGCFNGATCLDRVGFFVCHCPAGKTGLLCQLEDACASNPCRAEGAVCDTSPLDGSFTCNCPPGYKGKDCSEDIDECAMSSSSSSIIPNGNSNNNNSRSPHWPTPRYLSYRSVQSSPCEHDGMCINTIGSFKCHCPAGFTGPRCEVDVNECASSPCLNEGTCLDERGFYRCVCMPGFTGTRCQHEIDECANNPCNNGAICTDMVNGFKCICPPGFAGTTCSENIDDCQSNPCMNGATCKDSLDSYICKCPPGFNGPNCEINIDECANGPCRNGATCIDQVAHFICKCPIGFTGMLCQNSVNECLSSPCMFGGTCVDLIGAAAALEATKVGSNATSVVTPPAYLTRAQLHLQILDGNNRGYKCVCPPGTTGPRCQTNLDDCWSSPCLNNGTCTDLINGFRCTCPPGFTGPTCSLDVDECATGGVCMNGATCINMTPGFRCLCPVGFFGQTCTKDRDDCLSSPCMNGGQCRDHPGHGHYSCLCPAAFTGSRCESRAESNICNGNPCAHGSTCIPFNDVTDLSSRYTGNGNGVSNSGFRCACRPGYTGPRCETNINECDPDPCMNGGTCLDGQNSFTCLCPLPFSGHRCDISLDPCLVNSCSARSRCAQSPDLKNYTCLCDPGFTGPTCNDDINECMALEAPVRSYSYHARQFNRPGGFREVALCMNGGTCMNTVGSFQCYCPRGFTGPRCETDINECDGENICLHGGTCLDGIASFSCVCPQGYGGTRCEVPIQSCASSPCLQGARCMDAGPPAPPGSYKCHCPIGFSGRNCQFNDDDCSPSSCLNGGTCVDGINSFTCQCTTGFGGSNCQFRTDGTTISQAEPEDTSVCRTFFVRRKSSDGSDGDRCLESNPWRDCPTAAECFASFGNGVCDPQCNKRECVFDGMDCTRQETSTCNPLYDEYCLANYANGFCDQGCNNRECGWDGLDCVDNKTHAAAALPGTVTITMDKRVDYIELSARQDLAKIQRYLSSLVPGTVFELKGIHSDNKTGMGQLEMKVNQAFCDRGNECFASVIEVEEFLAALQSTQSTFSAPLPGSAMRISSISAFDPIVGTPKSGTAQNYSMTVMMSVGFVLVLSGVILGVLYQGGSIGSPGLGNFKPKLKAKGITWFPEGFERPNKSHQDITKRASAAARAAGGDFGRRPRMAYSDGQEMHSLSSSTQLMQREADMLHRQMISCHEQEVTDDITKPGSTTTTTTTYDSIYDEPLEDRRWTVQHLEAYQGRAIPGSNGQVLSPHTPIYDTIKRRLGSSSSPPPTSPYGMTPMSPGGPGPDVRGPGGMTPLMVASAFDSQTLFCQQPLSTQFTNYPASPSTLLLENNLMSDKSISSPQPKDVVGELIMNGASIDKQSDATGETSLHFAARYSRADAAKRLLDHNANANAVDFRNRTPLHAAVSADARGVFEILLHYRQTDINAADDMGYTPLMLAVKNNMQDMVDDLLAAEAQVDIVDKRMKTAMHWAACVNNVPAIKALLTAGANKDAQDEFEQTPLFLAAREGAKEAVEVLLAAGANRDITDHCDKLPRDAATSLEHYDIVALLDGTNVLIPSSQAGMVYQNVYQAPAQALTMMQRAETAQENASKGTLKKKSSARRPSCSSSSDPNENDNQQPQPTGKRATGRSQTLGRNKGSNGGNSNHRRSSSAARATSKNTMESSAASQLQQLQQQHQQQTQHTSPVSVPMTRGPLLSPPSSSSPMSASTFSPGSTLSPLALGGVSSPYSTSSHVSSPPHHAQHPSLSFPSVPMTQGFASHTTTLMQQQHQMLQPQHNQTQLNHNQHQQHVPPPAYDEAINFNHQQLDVNSYFSNFQQSYGSYDHHQDHLDHHYLTPSPDSPDHGGLIYSPDPPPRVTDWNDQNSNERHDLHSKPTASQQSVFI